MPALPGKISFFLTVPVNLARRRLLKKFLEDIFKKEAVTLHSLSYVFCSDKELLKLNRDWLSHDYLTDILTFDLSGSSGIEAEIYISVDRVKENAATYKTPVQSELLRVMIHGALHLSGYHDKSNKEKTAMREREDFYLKRFKTLVSRGAVPK